MHFTCGGFNFQSPFQSSEAVRPALDELLRDIIATRRFRLVDRVFVLDSDVSCLSAAAAAAPNPPDGTREQE